MRRKFDFEINTESVKGSIIDFSRQKNICEHLTLTRSNLFYHF